MLHIEERSQGPASQLGTAWDPHCAALLVRDRLEDGIQQLDGLAPCRGGGNFVLGRHAARATQDKILDGVGNKLLE